MLTILRLLAKLLCHMYNRPYAHDVISIGRPHLEVKRRLFIGQSSATRVQICAFDCFVTIFPLRWPLDEVNAFKVYAQGAWKQSPLLPLCQARSLFCPLLRLKAATYFTTNRPRPPSTNHKYPKIVF